MFTIGQTYHFSRRACATQGRSCLLFKLLLKLMLFLPSFTQADERTEAVKIAQMLDAHLAEHLEQVSATVVKKCKIALQPPINVLNLKHSHFKIPPLFTLARPSLYENGICLGGASYRRHQLLFQASQLSIPPMWTCRLHPHHLTAKVVIRTMKNTTTMKIILPVLQASPSLQQHPSAPQHALQIPSMQTVCRAVKSGQCI